mgnify:CR=1 FL=1
MSSSAPSSSRFSWLSQIALCLAVFAALWFFGQTIFPRIDDYVAYTVNSVGIVIILAVSLNLINGITGQFSLGHAGFMGIGAYVCAYFTKEIGAQIIDPVNLLIGLVCGALSAGIAGLLVGIPSLRLRGDYLAIVTLGFNLIIISIIQNLKIVGDASGYVGIPKLTTFAWVFGMVFLCILSIRNLAMSGLGRAMRAVRDDEIAAEAAGINTTQIKILAFVFSAMWAGVAGGLQANLIQYANPGDFEFLKSVEIVVAVVLGGLGSITGSALAAAGLKISEEILRSVQGVLWMSLGLIALAAFWSFQARRAAGKFAGLEIVKWLAAPLFSLAIVLGLYFFAGGLLEERKGSLRYILYALILIVVMLLRPQGILGRSEWSMNGLKRIFGRNQITKTKVRALD